MRSPLALLLAFVAAVLSPHVTLAAALLVLLIAVAVEASARYPRQS